MKRWRFLSLVVAGLLAACGQPADSGWSGYAEGDYVHVAAPIAGRLDQLAVHAGELGIGLRQGRVQLGIGQ